MKKVMFLYITRGRFEPQIVAVLNSSILSSFYPSSPISITHRSIRHWHLIKDEWKRKRKLNRKEKKKKKKRLFARHSPRCSFLSASLYGTMRKKNKKKNKKKTLFARHSPRCSFISVSLYGTMRKNKKKKNLLLGIRQDAIFLPFLFMVL